VLEIRNASKVYSKGNTQVTALNNVSLKVNNGDFIAIMGPSGSGKSTLLNIIGGLDDLSSGEVILRGKRIDNLDENALVDARRREIAYVFQEYHLLPSLTALENVLLPLIFRGVTGKTEEARDMLKIVGLERRASHKPNQLSGGEQQRVAIARALITHPPLILADEPTGNMDQKAGRQIMGLFDELDKDEHTIIMVTHNPEIAKYAKDVVLLQDGVIIDYIKSGRDKESTT